MFLTAGPRRLGTLGEVCQVSAASGTGKRVPDAGRQSSESSIVFTTWRSPNNGCNESGNKCETSRIWELREGGTLPGPRPPRV